MTYTVVIALTIISIFYILISYKFKNASLEDFLPISKKARSHILKSSDFSASTTASTISLVTVILSMFEAVTWFGSWLLWSVVTTTLGIVIVHLFSNKIWDKLSTYDDGIPSLHEFLSIEFNSSTIRKVSALMTSLGFLGAFAVELTVGSMFLGSLMPNIPIPLTVVFLATVSIIYTSLGGFRAVIKTDGYQMISIWIMIGSLLIFFIWHFTFKSEATISTFEIPKSLYDFSYREGLYAALIGLFLINTPIYLTDMSIWQRIAATKNLNTLNEGIKGTILSVFTSWTMLVILALLLVTVALPYSEEVNPLFTLLQYISSLGIVGSTLLFLISIGLFGAMLSTASTQIIASTHAFHMDVMDTKLEKSSIARNDQTLKKVRKILFFIGLISVITVYFFIYTGFSIVDLIFAVFGAQLGLLPAVFLALFCSGESNKKIKRFIPWSIILGFLSGWFSAILGQIYNDPSLVFLSPAFALSVSILVLLIAWVLLIIKRYAS